jgi:hypothetical protein
MEHTRRTFERKLLKMSGCLQQASQQMREIHAFCVKISRRSKTFDLLKQPRYGTGESDKLPS